MKLVVEIKTNLELARRRDNLWGYAERPKGKPRAARKRGNKWSSRFGARFASRNRLWGGGIILTASSIAQKRARAFLLVVFN